jgi:microcystin-dependent protein
MSVPFLSEIKLVSFNFPPKGWALCNGQLLPINQNQALFALLGTTYGGDGRVNFALPNLRGRVPLHFGGGHSLGEAAGSTSVTLNIQQLPQHIHQMQGKAAQATLGGGALPTPAGTKSLAQGVSASNPVADVNIYSTDRTGLTAMNAASVSNVGGSQPHNNMMPYLTLNFIIALQGIFPSQN